MCIREEVGEWMVGRGKRQAVEVEAQGIKR